MEKAELISYARSILNGEIMIQGVGYSPDRFEEAKRLVNKYEGDPNLLLQALRNLSFVREEMGFDHRFHLLVATIMLSLGFYSGNTYSEESIEEYNLWVGRAEELAPNDFQVQMAKVRGLQLSGQLIEAMALIKSLPVQEEQEKKNKKTGILIDLIINIARSTGAKVEVQELYRFTEEIQPWEGISTSDLFSLYSRKGTIYLSFDPIRSSYNYLKALKIRSDSPWTWHNLSISLKLSKFHSIALKASNRALSIVRFGAAETINRELRQEVSENELFKDKDLDPLIDVFYKLGYGETTGGKGAVKKKKKKWEEIGYGLAGTVLWYFTLRFFGAPDWIVYGIMVIVGIGLIITIFE